MRKILFIVTEIDSANGVCSCAVMQELHKRGNEIYCLTNQEYKRPAEYEKNGIYFYSVKPRLVYRIYSFMNSAGLNGFQKKFFQMIFVLLNKFKLAISVFMWPLISPMYTRRIYYSAKRLVNKKQIDIVIPVYNKIDAVIAANMLKTKYPQILYIPYFLDSLSGGYGPHIFSKEKTIQRGLWWEKKLLPKADGIILLQSSQAHHKLYSANFSYFSKMIFLDLPLIKYVPVTENKSKLLVPDRINLLFIGTIPKHVRNPQYLLETFYAVKNENLCLTIIGTSSCQEILDEAVKRDPRVRLLPFVSHEEAIEAMMTADFLVSIGNNNASMTPCKIFEYMSVGKPIISTAPIENEPSLAYLRRYPITCILDEKKDISENAKKLEAFIYEMRSHQVPFDEIKVEFPNNTPGAFADVIDSFCE